MRNIILSRIKAAGAIAARGVCAAVVLFSLLGLLVEPVSAQFAGEFPAGGLFGNNSAVRAPPRAITNPQVKTLLSIPISVTDPAYGADPTGVADSAPAIAAAILALPVYGGDIIFPCGTYKITTSILLGNGSGSAVSTRSGIRLIGVGTAIVPTPSQGYATTPCVMLSWAGATNGSSMIQVTGPLQGWGVQNIAFNCNNSAGFGLRNISAQFGDSKNLSFEGCLSAGIGSTVWSTNTTGEVQIDALHDNYLNIVVVVANSPGAVGILCTGNTAVNSDTAYDTYQNVAIFLPITGANTTYGVYLQVADSNKFINAHFVGGVATSVVIELDYQVAAAYPQTNSFYGLDPSGSLVPPIRYQTSGTPVASFFNVIYDLDQANGAGFPNNAGLCAFGPNVLQVCGSNSGRFAVAASSLGSPQYGATVTNDNVAAGNIGEFISSDVVLGSCVALAGTNTITNVTSISLTAGDWDVWGNVVTCPNGTAVTSQVYSWTNTVSAAYPAAFENGGSFSNTAVGSTAGQVGAVFAGYRRYSVAATTTVYLECNVFWVTSTNGCYGFIGARRAR